MFVTGASDVVARQALTSRASPLSAWEKGESASIVADLLLRSRDLFEQYGNQPAAGVSTALTGLLLSDAPDPLPALTLFQAALPEVQRSGPRFLLVLCALGQALCF